MKPKPSYPRDLPEPEAFGELVVSPDKEQIDNRDDGRGNEGHTDQSQA